jgi:hypothetical protein
LIAEFEVVFDDEALRWLGERPSADPLVIAYEDSRCCGGGHIRDLRLRGGLRREEEAAGLIGIGEVNGRPSLLDRRIMSRVPRRIPVTVRGLSPFRSLHLDFSGEEWARLLYEIV